MCLRFSGGTGRHAGLKILCSEMDVWVQIPPEVHFTNFKKEKAMKELLNKINTSFEEFNTNAQLQADKGNKAAGVRARKASLELEKLMKDFRKSSVVASK